MGFGWDARSLAVEIPSRPHRRLTDLHHPPPLPPLPRRPPLLPLSLSLPLSINNVPLSSTTTKIDMLSSVLDRATSWCTAEWDKLEDGRGTDVAAFLAR
jgi:hypothetical protein